MRKLLVMGAFGLLMGCPQSIVNFPQDSGSDDGGGLMCGSGTTRCDLACVVLTSDDLHCGMCRRPCGATDSCANGACLPDDCVAQDCASGQVCINNTLCLQKRCVGVSCNAGETCDEGVCKPESCGASACPAGNVCRAGVCVDVQCEGVTCQAGLRCVRGSCAQVDAGLSDAGLSDAGTVDAGTTDGGLWSRGTVAPGGSVTRSANYRNVGLLDQAPPPPTPQSSTGYRNSGGLQPVMKR